MKSEKLETYAQLVNDALTCAMDCELVFEAIQSVLTLNGKFDLEESFLSLTYFEREIYNLAQREKIRFAKQQIVKENCLYVYYFSNHKLVIALNEQKDATLLGIVNMDTYKNDIELFYEEDRRLFAQAAYESKSFLEGLEEVELHALIKNILHYFEHMAPVFYYVRNKLFTNFYDLNNLYPKGKDYSSEFILTYLIKEKASEWVAEDSLFIYSIHLLLSSGNPTRAEEFNGQQMFPFELHNFFDEKYYDYCELLHIPNEFSYFKALDLMEKSKKLKELFLEVNDKVTLYREINGITLRKKEKYIFFKEIDNVELIINENLERHFQLKEVNLKSIYNLSRKLVEQELTGQINQNDPTSSIQALVQMFISSVTEQTHSDVGITRFFTDIGELIKLVKAGEFNELCNLTPKSYSCYVAPSKMLSKKMNPMQLAMMATSIASRMNYNSWHYIPGNFLTGEVDTSSRSYYFPPKLSDITKLSKYHHVGHVKLAINNCIRCPYFIRIEDKVFEAFMDIRLLRMGEWEFTEKELEIAIVYTKYLAQVYQAIIDGVSISQKPYSLIDFNKEWYADNYAFEGEKYEKNTIY